MNTTEPCGEIAKLYCDTTKISNSTPLPMINKDQSLSQVTPCPPLPSPPPMANY